VGASHAEAVGGVQELAGVASDLQQQGAVVGHLRLREDVESDSCRVGHQKVAGVPWQAKPGVEVTSRRHTTSIEEFLSQRARSVYIAPPHALSEAMSTGNVATIGMIEAVGGVAAVTRRSGSRCRQRSGRSGTGRPAVRRAACSR
jgi:hypothetical protein